jgi:hypothetical protein
MNTFMTDLGFHYDWLVLDVIPHDQDWVWSPLNLQVCDPGRPTTAVSGGPDRRRWEFMRLPGETVTGLNREDRTWQLLTPCDTQQGNATLERHTVLTFQARWAGTWHEGRVLVAGDAARQMPPFAGQGMCSGLRDAANLSWMLDLVLSGLPTRRCWTLTPPRGGRRTQDRLTSRYRPDGTRPDRFLRLRRHTISRRNVPPHHHTVQQAHQADGCAGAHVHRVISYRAGLGKA